MSRERDTPTLRTNPNHLWNESVKIGGVNRWHGHIITIKASVEIMLRSYLLSSAKDQCFPDPRIAAEEVS